MSIKNNKILNLLRLFRRAFSGYKKQIIAMSVLVFFSGVFEGVGVNAVIPLFSFLGSAPSGELDMISQLIKDFFSFFHIRYSLKSLLIFIAAAFMFKAVLLFASKFISNWIIYDYQRAARSKTLRLVMRSDWPKLSKQKVGYLDQVLITDINYSAAALSHLSVSILVIANLVIYGLVVVNISPIIALITLFSGSSILLLFRPFFYKNKLFSEKISALYKQTAHFMSESIIGMKTLKAMCLENSLIKIGDQYFNRLKNLNIKSGILQNVTSTLLQPIGLVFIVGIFAFFYKIKGFDFASFAVIVYAINKLFAYFQLVEAEIHNMASLSPYVSSVLRYQEEVASHQEIGSGDRKFDFKKELSFNKVNFYYNPERSVLTDLNFTIGKGQVVGLIGSSGAGKTTIGDLVLRLLKPVSGTITLDGVDINKINLADWRSHVGYVSQDVFLLNDTIENNIKFYDESITRDNMLTAVKMAHCAEFIERSPQGLATLVGERGMSLSGGQRQRVALARVLARRPSVLILDEATSALDNESEMAVQRAIEELRGSITVLVIAHRLSTVTVSDKLIVLEKGMVVEEGAPRDLLANRESYFSKAYNLK